MRPLRTILACVLALLVVTANRPAIAAADVCPVRLLRGTAEPSRLSITFINTGNEAIRTLSFHCKLVDAPNDKADVAHCYDTDAHYLPNHEDTTAYSIDVRGPVLVSMKEVVFANGRKWKAKPSQCDVLKIVPKYHRQPSSR